MKYAKKNLVFFLIIMLISVGTIVCSLFIKSVDKHRKQTIMGIAVPFAIIGLLGAIQCVRLMKNPKKAEEVEICKTEERTVFIREKTNSLVYTIFIYVESMMIVIASVLGYRQVVIFISVLLIAKLIAWFIIVTYYGNNN